MRLVYTEVYEFEVELNGIPIGKTKECAEIACQNGWNNITINGTKYKNAKFKQKIIQNWISALCAVPIYTIDNVIADVYDTKLSFDLFFTDQIKEIDISSYINTHSYDFVKNFNKNDVLNIKRLNIAKKLYFLPTILLCFFLSIALLGFGINIAYLYNRITGIFVLIIGILFLILSFITTRKLLKRFPTISKIDL